MATLQQVQIDIHRLEQSCQEAKQRLAATEQQLKSLITVINHRTQGSVSGRNATMVTQSAAQKINKATLEIQSLEQVLSNYLKSVTGS